MLMPPGLTPLFPENPAGGVNGGGGERQAQGLVVVGAGVDCDRVRDGDVLVGPIELNSRSASIK